MNITYSKLTISILLFVFAFTLSKANNIPNELVVCFKTGNSKALANYFFSNIELQVLEDENVYSKAQAEQIIKRFFEQNKPADFVILHQSGKDGSEYAIGTLHTSTGKFRVYFLLKTQGASKYIHQLTIKKENG